MNTQKTKTRTSPFTADSMKSAAGILSIPLAAVKDAKAAGCHAFRNGRIDLDELRAWFALHPLDTQKPPPSFWENRRDAIFNLTDEVDGAYGDGEIDFPTYERAILGALDAGAVLAKAWGLSKSEVDVGGWRRLWLEDVEEERAKLTRDE